MPRLPTLVPTLVLAGAALALLLVLLLGSSALALVVSAPAGAVASLACEILARRDHREHAHGEPWRLDGWAVMVATLAVIGLGASIGPQASGAVWLLIALIAGLGFASLPNLAPRPRP